MKRLLVCLIFESLCLNGAYAQFPFKYDGNQLYTTVFLNDAFKLMASSPEYLLLDVRSPGEFADTSQYMSLNIGRLKNAVNISIDSVPGHLEELKKYGSKKIFVYCSHSQRSRRVSKLLAENGFKNIFNINGGMSAVNESDVYSFPAKKDVFETSKGYSNVAARDALDLIEHQHDLLIIDIRNESEFESRDSSMQNNIGRLKNAVNIPQKDFDEKFAALGVPKDRELLIYDLYGSSSGKIALSLTEKGYTQVHNLYEGLAEFLSNNMTGEELVRAVTEKRPPYNILSVRQSIFLMRRQNLVVLDARPESQFDNQDSIKYLNLGHMNGAKNVYSSKKLDSICRILPISTPILVYGSGNDNLASTIANALCGQGFSQVNLLYQGLYRFVWSSFNLEECKEGIGFMTDHKELY